MTRADINKMDAGPAMDRSVCKRLGLTSDASFSPSTNLLDTWSLIEKVAELNFVKIYNTEDDEWTVCIGEEDPTDFGYPGNWAGGKTIEVAICRAVLLRFRDFSKPIGS